MVSIKKQISNKHKLVAERTQQVVHFKAVADAAQSELKLRNRSLLDANSINQALNRQLQRERAESADMLSVSTTHRRNVSDRLMEAQVELRQERKWKRVFMGIALLNTALALVDYFFPAITDFTRGLSLF